MVDVETTLYPQRHVHFIWVLHGYDWGRGRQPFALKEPNSPFVTIRNPAGAAKLSSGPKTSVIPKMIPKKKGLYLPPKGATTGGSKSAGCRPLDLGNQKSLTDCTQTKFQSDFSESFQCIVSNRSFISQQKPNFSVCVKIFLRSFLPFFRVSVKSLIHSFIFLIFDETCNGVKHHTRERFPNWEAWTSLKRDENVSHDHLKIWLVYYFVKESVMINIF